MIKVFTQIWSRLKAETARLFQSLGALSLREEQVYLALSLVLGVIVGLVIVTFIILSEHIGGLIHAPGSPAWRRLVAPVIGALVTGYLLFRFFPNARGSGIPHTKVAMLLHGGYMTLRTVIGRFICSTGALASGIALGREGPSVQIGAGLASVIGRRIGLGPSRIRALIPVGSAAAVSAAFNTPVAGVLFALEEIMGDLHAPVLGSAVLASATAWVTLHLFLGNEPLFHVPEYELVHPAEFLVYAALGLAGGLCSVAFLKLTLWMRAKFLRARPAFQPYTPVIGGLVVGVLGMWTPEVLGVGYDFVGQVLNGESVPTFVAWLLVMKLIATSACYASGNAGGIFGPSLFLGAMLGALVGHGAQYLLPGLTGSTGAYALVGMGALFAGIIRVPLTSVFMIFELTRDYAIVVPLMIANLVSFVLSRKFQRIPVYEAFALQDGIHLPKPGWNRGESQNRVADVADRDVAVVPAATLIADVPEGASAVAVLAEDGWPAGAITRWKLQQAMRAGKGRSPVATLMEGDGLAPHVHPDQPVEFALERLQDSGADALPVLDRGDVRSVVGVITLARVHAAFGVRSPVGPREPR